MLVRYACSLVASFLLVAATGCAPTYLLGVQPAASHSRFASDQPEAVAVADSVSLSLRFLGYEPGWVVFDAAYRNDSSQPIEITPTRFAYAPQRDESSAAALRVRRGERVSAATAAASQHLPYPSLPLTPLAALDPEPSIEQLQTGASKEAAKASRPDWAGLALFAVALGADIASASRGSETRTQAQNREVIHNIAWAYSAVSSANRVRHAVTAETMAIRAEQFSQYALRRVQLLPGQQVRGYVYLPRFDEADGLRVLAPVGSRQVPLDFVQTHQRR
jgi:hypothetical protein